MDDVQLLITETARKLFEKHAGRALLRAGLADPRFEEYWAAFEAAGLHKIMLDEELREAGLAVGIGFALIRLSAWHAAPGPIAETLLASWIAARVGLAVPEGQLTLALGRDGVELQQEHGGGWRVHGKAADVAWGRSATVLLVTERDDVTSIALLPPGAGFYEPGYNLANEPRDLLEWNTSLPPGAAVDAAGLTLQDCRALGAAVRAAQIAGAAERVCQITVEHVRQRVQFGKPLASFQAIQQSLAKIATATAASSVAADRAMQSFAGQGVNWVPAAVGKIRSGEAAGMIAGLAHQLNGAIGFTEEYMLHWLTKRLWAWRDEFGGESDWARLYGERLIAAGADNLWPGFVNS